MKKIISIVALMFLVSIGYSQTTWTIDQSHSKIGFNVTHMVVAEVEGKFKQFEGKVTAPSDAWKKLLCLRRVSFGFISALFSSRIFSFSFIR